MKRKLIEVGEVMVEKTPEVPEKKQSNTTTIVIAILIFMAIFGGFFLYQWNKTVNWSHQEASRIMDKSMVDSQKMIKEQMDKARY